MKTLRGKIFLYVSLLLVLPSVPLSFFVLELLDKSYRIGVNDQVESALDGALEISADMYQFHRNRLNAVIDIIQMDRLTTEGEIGKRLLDINSDVAFKIADGFEGIDSGLLVSEESLASFVKKGTSKALWPAPDHTVLYALARLDPNTILQIRYPMPASFQKSAGRVQEVNQIFKTLSYARKDIRRSFLYTFLSIYATGVILALVVLNRLSKRITRPVKQLMTATREIGSGNLEHRIELSRKDEFAALGTAFNNMASELKENQQRIIELEKTAAWQQLARKLAHEIKNPLTPIQLMAQQMVESYRGDNETYRQMLNECYNIIDEELESLKRLVREFSDFARLPGFQFQEQSVMPLLDTLAKLYASSNLKVHHPKEDIVFSYDMDYLKRALINLIDNALAASSGGEEVALSLRASSGEIDIEVEDNGQGISEENLSEIFEPYYSSKSSGVGLGLPIVRKIVEEHGGGITVSSIPGKGTLFRVTLPSKREINS